MVALLSPNSFLAVTLYFPASSTVTLRICNVAEYRLPSSLLVVLCKDTGQFRTLNHFVWLLILATSTNLMPRALLNILWVVRPWHRWSGVSFDLTLENELFAVVLLTDRRFFNESGGSAIDLPKNRTMVLWFQFNLGQQWVTLTCLSLRPRLADMRNESTY